MANPLTKLLALKQKRLRELGSYESTTGTHGRVGYPKKVHRKKVWKANPSPPISSYHLPAGYAPKYKVLPYDLRKFFSSEGKPTRIYTKGKKKGGKIISLDKPVSNFSPYNADLEIRDKKAPIKKGIWLEGAKRIDNRKDFVKSLDKIYGDALKTYDKSNLTILFGGNRENQADFIIENWAKSKGIKTQTISPFNKKLFDQSGPKEGRTLRQIERREAKLHDWKKKGYITNLFSLSPEGKVTYDFKDRNKWFKRFDALSKEFGKGNTRKIIEAYLDEVEDEFKGTSRQASLKTDFVQKTGDNTYKHQTSKQLDMGVGRKFSKKPNISSGLAALEVLQNKAEWTNLQRKSKLLPGQVLKEYLSESNKIRISNLQADVPTPLGYGQRFETDYADQPGNPQGKEHIVTDSTGSAERIDYKKSPKVFQPPRMMWGVAIDPKPGELRPNVQVVDTNNPHTKPAFIQELITDVINTNPKDIGIKGKNVFGDYFKSINEKEALDTKYQGSLDEIDEGVEVYDESDTKKKNPLELKEIADKNEIKSLDELIEKRDNNTKKLK